jgi:type IX secretion system PorP/SprF family membrane protein
MWATKFLLIFMILAPLLESKSQDIHLTDYKTFSNFFNPAQTGDYLGYVKVQASTRTQYERTYEQGMIGTQFNAFSPISKKHWIGVGLNFVYDRSGSLSLETTGGDLLMAYHIPLGKKQNQTISIGGSYGFATIGADTKNYKSENTILGNFDPDKLALSTLNTQIFSSSAGIYFKSKILKIHLLKAGISIIRLNSPVFSVLGNKSEASWGKRLNVFVSHKHTINKMIQIEPAIYFSQSENQNNINLQIFSEWKLTKKSNWKAAIGIAQRWDESTDFITGYKTENLYISLAFDILSSSSAGVLRNPGAIELGGYYIFYKNTKPKIKPTIFCPKL